MAITERLSQAVEKAWRIEQLEEANHAYTQMLGFVSHELKSPVASMVTDAQLLTQGYLGDLTPRAARQAREHGAQGRSTCSASCASTSTSRGSRAASSGSPPQSRVDVMERGRRGGRRPRAARRPTRTACTS